MSCFVNEFHVTNALLLCFIAFCGGTILTGPSDAISIVLSTENHRKMQPMA